MTTSGDRRVVLVTGASSGVGRATVRELAQRGCDVGLVARGRDGLEAAAGEVESFGRRALVVPADVADTEQVEAAAEAVERDLGPIDVWVNNAMTSVFSPFVEMEPDEFRRVTEVTYLGYVNGTRAALRRMRPRDRGAIVQVGSALAYRGIPLQSAYCGAKHAIQGFTESVRAELLHEGSGVRLIEVHLPALNTPQFDHVRSRLGRRAQPVPPIYQPEVAARAIAWASEHDDWEVHVGATTVATVTANKVAPRLLDRYLGKAGFESQQTDEPEDAQRPDNLWEPLSGDHGAHGRFDDRAHPRSFQWWLNERRRVAGAAVALAALGILAARRRGR